MDTTIKSPSVRVVSGSSSPQPYRNVNVQQVVSFPELKGSVITCVQYSQDGNFIVSGDVNGRMQILSANTGIIIMPVKHYKHGSGSITCMRFHPQKPNTFFVSSANGTINRCDVTTGASQNVAIENDNVINCIDISTTGSHVISVGKDLKVRLYDEPTMQVLRTFVRQIGSDDSLVGHVMRVFGLKCHPDYNDIFITGGWDNQLKVWDSRTVAGVVDVIPGPHICGDSIDIKGSYILSGSWVKTNALQLWDFNTRRLVKGMQFRHGGDGEYLYCAKFANDQIVLAGGSGTNSAQAINMHTDELVAEVKLGHAVLAMHSVLDGRKFCVAGSSRHIKLCSMNN